MALPISHHDSDVSAAERSSEKNSTWSPHWSPAGSGKKFNVQSVTQTIPEAVAVILAEYQRLVGKLEAEAVSSQKIDASAFLPPDLSYDQVPPLRQVSPVFGKERGPNTPMPKHSPSGASLPSGCNRPSFVPTMNAVVLAEQCGKAERTVSLKLAREYALSQGWIKKHHGKSPSGLAKIVLSNRFDTACAIAIIMNSVLLGITTDYAATNNLGTNDDPEFSFILMDRMFSLWFVLELLLRIAAEGPMLFCSCISPNWTWNIFDTVVVLVNVVEVSWRMVSRNNSGGSLTTLRMLRVLRVARALRIVRLVRLFKALRMMVLSIMNSFTTLLWAMLLLLIIIFIFSVFLTQNVTAYLYDDGPSRDGKQDSDVLYRYFGSLPKSLYTLFMSVSGGVSWQIISDPLFRISFANGLLFCFYTFFTLFAMLNIITGIFLDTAMHAAQNDKDECISEQIHCENSTLSMLQQIFRETDYDESGSITEEEFRRHMTDPRVRAHLGALGIEHTEAQGLFKLLDMDGSCEITIDEFLFGCLRVKGHAKAIDVATLMYENKRMIQKWSLFMGYVEKQFKLRHTFEQRVEFKIDSLRRTSPSPRKPEKIWSEFDSGEASEKNSSKSPRKPEKVWSENDLGEASEKNSSKDEYFGEDPWPRYRCL